MTKTTKCQNYNQLSANPILYMHSVEQPSDSTDDANFKNKFISWSADKIQTHLPTYYLRDYWLQRGVTVGCLELMTLLTGQTDVLLHLCSIVLICWCQLVCCHSRFHMSQQSVTPVYKIWLTLPCMIQQKGWTTLKKKLTSDLVVVHLHFQNPAIQIIGTA